MRSILIAGAGGHARSLIELLEQVEWRIEGLLDEGFNPSQPEIVLGYPIIGSFENAKVTSERIIIGKGHLPERTQLYTKLQKFVISDNLVHPTAIVSQHSRLGVSNQVFAHAVINAEATIGNHNIINTASVIEHNASIGHCNHISVGAILCGKVSLGSECFIGAGAVIIDGITITDKVTVGANAVVIKDILEPGTYVGNPVRKIA